jgi:hypothetical protein
VAGGDARNALNALELAVESTPPGEDGVIHITLDVAQESIQRRAVLYDKDGDDGRTPGYFGIAFLGSRLLGPNGPPLESGLNGVKIFAGLLPFERGGGSPRRGRRVPSG